MCGGVLNVHMGLNKQNKTPCGFCFVEYQTREDARIAIDCLNLSLVDGKRIRVDWDYGVTDERQFGRGIKGGQKRDEIQKRKSYNQHNNYYNNHNQNQNYERNDKGDNDYRYNKKRNFRSYNHNEEKNNNPEENYREDKVYGDDN